MNEKTKPMLCGFCSGGPMAGQWIEADVRELVIPQGQSIPFGQASYLWNGLAWIWQGSPQPTTKKAANI